MSQDHDIEKLLMLLGDKFILKDPEVIEKARTILKREKAYWGLPLYQKAAGKLKAAGIPMISGDNK